MNINNNFHSNNQSYQLNGTVAKIIKDRLRLLITSVTHETISPMANENYAFGLSEKKIANQIYRIIAMKEKNEDNSGSFKVSYQIQNITINEKYFSSPSFKLEQSKYDELIDSKTIYLDDTIKTILGVLKIDTSSPSSQPKNNNH